jgi:hypothetical protein
LKKEKTVIIGAHSILYSRNPDADRAFLQDVLRFPSVDVGGGWLIFGLPPSEVAVHPAEENDVHELYLMCDDLPGFLADMGRRGIACGPVHTPGWGVLTHVRLPGGGKLGVYEPRHARPKPMRVGKPARKPATKGPARKTRKRTASRTAGRRRSARR